jgi:hypothetical protein
MRLARSVAVAWSVVAALSCGYRPVDGGAGGGGRLHVKLVRSLVADAVASDEVALGVREELAKYQALEGGDGYPRVEVEVLKDDESAEGLAAGASGAIAPVARGTTISLVARGWVVAEAGASPERDTGDLHAEELIAVDERAGALDPRASVFHEADALRSAARRLGRLIARRVMGMPAAG